VKWRIHFKQYQRTTLRPFNEFWWVVEGNTAEEARQNLLNNIEYWASINQLADADHNAKNQPYPPYVPTVYKKNVLTQIYEVVRVRDNASN
jgi:hypothetical protein